MLDFNSHPCGIGVELWTYMGQVPPSRRDPLLVNRLYAEQWAASLIFWEAAEVRMREKLVPVPAQIEACHRRVEVCKLALSEIQAASNTVLEWPPTVWRPSTTD